LWKHGSTKNWWKTSIFHALLTGTRLFHSLFQS
jgi:hypothetical protein